MHHAHVHRLEDSGRGPTLRIAGHDGPPARPAWRFLTGALIITMALWAAGIVELPASDGRLVDWIGTLMVLIVLVVWVRVNAASLAGLSAEPDRDARLRVRMIHSQPAPLESIGGPDIKPFRRRRRRALTS